MVARHLTGAVRPRRDGKVRSEDLANLSHIHDLLRLLNDPYASASEIAKLVEQIPVLAVRCRDRALSKAPKLELNGMGHALTLIGNRGLETELLQLLEDLTILKTQLSDT